MISWIEWLSRLRNGRNPSLKLRIIKPCYIEYRALDQLALRKVQRLNDQVTSFQAALGGGRVQIQSSRAQASLTSPRHPGVSLNFRVAGGLQLQLKRYLAPLFKGPEQRRRNHAAQAPTSNNTSGRLQVLEAV